MQRKEIKYILFGRWLFTGKWLWCREAACTKIVVFLLFPLFAASQQNLPDSLHKVFLTAENDSAKFQIGRFIYTFYEETNRDSALHYAQLRYAIAQKYNRKTEQAYTQGQVGYQQIYLGRFSEVLTNLTKAKRLITSLENESPDTWDLTAYKTIGKNRQLVLSMLNHMFGHLLLQTGNSEYLNYFKEGRRIGLEIDNSFRVTVGDMVIASRYVALNKPDSALFFAQEGEKYGARASITKYLVYIWFVLGDVYVMKGNNDLGLMYYHKAITVGKKEGNINGVAIAYERLFRFYRNQKNTDSILYYATKHLEMVKSMGAVTGTSAGELNIGMAHQYLAEAFLFKKNTDSAFKYQQLALILKDSFNTVKLKNLADFQQLTLNEQLRLQAIEQDRVRAKNRNQLYLLLSAIIVALIIMLLIYRNNRQKQKAYKLLQKQKAETDLQKEKADHALLELKSAQSQLIQSEKMASLGELTAGIAHEIQNPLNFVNNFSEVSRELIEELKNQKEKLKSEEREEILNDIDTNLEKINHHGKRADAIVKGMLQHSQSGKGQKELTDINALADEYLRLSYHGLRAKNKDFNATMKMDFDESIGNINIISQDIGRVLLNLYNNAFYAVNEKAASFKLQPAPGGYEPTVTVSTKKLGAEIEIRVADNGDGIPQKMVDKIFQPFFTTKPTGSGTGLGLSLSYDIVKAHAGEIKVETKKGEGTGFIVYIPII